MQPICFDETFLTAINEYRQSSHAQQRIQRYLDLLNPSPGQQILDLGCGSGEFCRALVPYVAPNGRVTGIDSAPDALAVSSRLSSSVDSALLTFESGDGHCLRHTSGSFDAATCISVLAFCNDPTQVLRELGRVLRPEGRLLVTCSDEDTRIYNSHDRVLGRRVLKAIADRTLDPWAGRRLASWLRNVGFTIVSETVHTNAEYAFAPGHSGYTLAHALRPYLLHHGIAVQDYDQWLAELHSCAAEGSYCYCTTTFGYLAVKSA